MSSMNLATNVPLYPQQLTQSWVDQLPWFAVQTRPRFEKKVATELREKGIEAFLPLQPSLRQWSDRRKMVDTPLFPGYVFLQATAEANARVAVLRTTGVTSL